MLTVIGIIALLVGLVTPALVDVIRSTRLNSAGDGLVNRLSLAQQSAVSLGKEVEVRFYRYPDEDADASGAPNYYAYQVVQLPVVGETIQPKALSDVYYIESGVILSSQEDLSPLLQTAVAQQALENGTFLFTPTVARLEPSSVEYAALKFFADGSCKILSGNTAATDAEENALAYTIPPLVGSFLTLVEARDAAATQPRNFYCIQLDAYTGKSRVYRP